MTNISNHETVDPGTLVRKPRGTVVFEVIETAKPGAYLRGKLRDTRTGRSVGWAYLDFMVRCDAYGNEALS